MPGEVENSTNEKGQAPIGPDAQAAKLAALAENSNSEAADRAAIAVMDGAGKWQEATVEQRRAFNEALSRLEIKNNEVLELCANDPELQEVLDKGAKEYRKRDLDQPPGRRILRDERQKEDFMQESIIKGGIFAVKRELSRRGVLDNRYIPIDKAA